MDRICGCVLEKICSLAATGNYVIISEDEFYESFPESADRTESELKKAVKELASDGFIDVKYSGGDLYCVAPLKNYEPEEPSKEAEADIEEIIPEKPAKALPLFFAAFAGGAAGSLIISLIFALVL